MAIALLASGCGGIERPAETAPPLSRSAVCSVASQDVQGRPSSTPVATITMNNDRGWCWMMSVMTVRGDVMGPWLRVTQQPRNGEISIVVLRAETRVAYRPNPGFIGTDAFATVDETRNIPVSYEVTVLRGP